MSRNFLCLDIGGTNTRIGVVSDKLEVRASQIRSTPELARHSIAEGLQELVAEWVAKMAAGQMAVAQAVGLAAPNSAAVDQPLADQLLSGVVVGVPATVDAACRRVLQAPNVDGLSGLDLADLLEAVAGVPVVIEKDVNLLILSDIHDLGIDPSASVAGVYFGTGIGNALYLGGQVWHGANGVAGELGHVPQFGRTEVCGCGNPGCLECFGGGHHLAAVMREHFPQTPIGKAFVYHSAAPQVEEVLDAMAIAVATEANVLDPAEVIIGGGLPAMEGFDREAFAERVRTHLRKPYPAQTLSLRYSRQGQLSGLVGGALRMRAQEGC